jgi:hypothetical protein
VSTVENIADPKKMNKYVSKFIFVKEYADALVSALASQYAVGRTQFTFTSETFAPAGALVHVTLGDGTDMDALVMTSVWNEATLMWQYTLIGYGLSRPALTAQTATLAVQIDPVYTFGVQQAVGSPEAVVAATPRYTNIVVPDALDSASVTLYAVGVRTKRCPGAWA